MRLVATLKAAAHRLGPERRILLLHGPVGSAKSTIACLLKKGLEAYSRTEEGRLYTFYWKTEEGPLPCPMHEEPLHLLPRDLREAFLEELRALHPDYPYPLEAEGELCPVCRFQMREALKRYEGDLAAVLENEVVVKRLVLSEKDRVGIGTFQPKDEKNQDATELTGDINYRKVALYGSDSDPRAFNFDGELNIANRGLVEFIEGTPASSSPSSPPRKPWSSPRCRRASWRPTASTPTGWATSSSRRWKSAGIRGGLGRSTRPCPWWSSWTPTTATGANSSWPTPTRGWSWTLRRPRRCWRTCTASGAAPCT